MNIDSYILRVVCALTLLLATRTHLEAQGTAFSYQGGSPTMAVRPTAITNCSFISGMLIRSWSSVAASSDASRLVATVQNGLIYTSILANGVSSSVGTAGYLLGDQYSSIELQYVGNGQFIPLSHIGTISAY